MNDHNDSSSALGEQYPLTDVEETSKTRERILLESTILFAQRGFSAVSMKDLAQAVGIKSASLYNHFDSKETLWNAVVEHAISLYRLYFDRLDEVRSSAKSFDDVLNFMFIELKQVVNIFTYYAFCLIETEQFSQENAGSAFNDIFLKYSIDYIRDWLDESVHIYSVKPFDTGTVATTIMHSVLVGMEVRVQEHMGRAVAYDVSTMFTNLQAFLHKSILGDATS